VVRRQARARRLGGRADRSAGDGDPQRPAGHHGSAWGSTMRLADDRFVFVSGAMTATSGPRRGWTRRGTVRQPPLARFLSPESRQGHGCSLLASTSIVANRPGTRAAGRAQRHLAERAGRPHGGGGLSRAQPNRALLQPRQQRHLAGGARATRRDRQSQPRDPTSRDAPREPPS